MPHAWRSQHPRAFWSTLSTLKSPSTPESVPSYSDWLRRPRVSCLRGKLFHCSSTKSMAPSKTLKSCENYSPQSKQRIVSIVQTLRCSSLFILDILNGHVLLIISLRLIGSPKSQIITKKLHDQCRVLVGLFRECVKLRNCIIEGLHYRWYFAIEY